jgi:hypothetical protein
VAIGAVEAEELLAGRRRVGCGDYISACLRQIGRIGFCGHRAMSRQEYPERDTYAEQRPSDAKSS